MMPEIPEIMPPTKDRTNTSAQRAAAGPTMRSFEEQKRKLKPRSKGWIAWWPVAVGVALGCLSPLLSSLLVPYEPWGMRLVFPFVLLPGLRETGLSDELRRNLPQVMLFLQFPLEGLLTKITLSRGVKLPGAVGQLVFLHLVSVLVLWMVVGTH
jgi:hypothetical protein